MRINHNLMAMNTQRSLGINNDNTSKSLEKLSSGLRINRAGDDAAGLAISEKMRGQIRGLDRASANSQDGISLIQTAEGGLNEVHDILQRMRELAVQAANDTNVTVDRGEIQKEINALTSEINRIGNTTEYNTMKLLDGSRGSSAVISAAKTIGASTQIFQPQNTVGVTWSGGLSSTAPKPNFMNGDKANEIGFSTDGIDWSKVTGSGSSTLKITFSGNNLYVAVNVINASGSSLFSEFDTVFADAMGGFSYDSHGINFTLSKEEVAKFTAADTVTIDLEASAAANNGYLDAKVNLAESWTNYSGATTVAKAKFTSDGIKVDSSNSDTIDARTIDFRISGGSAYVVVKNATGSSMFSDVCKTSGLNEFSYDSHGISFTLTNIEDTDRLVLSQLKLTTTTVERKITADQSLKLQTGANAGQSMVVDIGDMRSKALGISALGSNSTKDILDSMGDVKTAVYTKLATVSKGTDNNNTEYALDVSTHDRAAAALQVIDDAIAKVSAERSLLGANQNRLEHTIKNLDTSSENLSAAESRIRDVDMAKEMMNFTKSNILQQAAQAMLAQANQQPQGILQLLR
jgi:flagellin